MTRSEESRAYDLVTPEELRQIRKKSLKHADLYGPIRAMKAMAAGEGIKIRCSGNANEAIKKQKAAAQIARREKIPVRTMLRGEWLFIEKTANR